ncbi:MAG: RNA polymerase sigma factor [Pseudomonadota bacterium]
MFGIADDGELIAKALGGSQRAWLSLVRRHEKRVYNLAYRMTGNRQDALDLMQEAFLAVYRNLPNYRAEGVFAAWLLRIVANRAVDFLRRRRGNPLHKAAEVDEDVIVADDSSHRRVEQDSLRSTLLRLMAQLSNDQRLVVELKFFQHLTFEEIAGQLGIPENTAKTRLYTALQKLRGNEELKHAL